MEPSGRNRYMRPPDTRSGATTSRDAAALKCGSAKVIDVNSVISFLALCY